MQDIDFDKWSEFKKQLHKSKSGTFYNRGEVWLCSVGVNIGSEQGGTNNVFARPVIILRKFNNTTFWGIPVTSKIKKSKNNYIFYWNGKFETALLSQLRLFDERRLHRKLGTIDPDVFKLMRRKLRNLI